MRERTVVYKDDDYDVEIVVRQASVEDSFRRMSLHSREKARLTGREGEEFYLPLRWTALRTYPELVSCTAEIKNLDADKKQLSSDLSLDDFLQLPEALVFTWEGATYECNPHLMPQRVQEEDKSGEAEGPGDNSNSTKDSSPGSKTESQKKNPTGTSTT